MEAIASAYSDVDSSGSESARLADPKAAHRSASDPCDPEALAGAAKRPRLAPTEVDSEQREDGDGHESSLADMHYESLARFQQECPVLPSERAASARREQWAWFKAICDAEFAPELGEEEDDERGLQLFGSWTYDLWLTTSDFDANMFTRKRIPDFFARLKRAVLAAAPSAEARPSIVEKRASRLTSSSACLLSALPPPSCVPCSGASPHPPGARRRSRSCRPRACLSPRSRARARPPRPRACHRPPARASSARRVTPGARKCRSSAARAAAST